MSTYRSDLVLSMHTSRLSQANKSTNHSILNISTTFKSCCHGYHSNTPPPGIKSFPSAARGVVGSGVRITCIANGESYGTNIAWYKDGSVLNEGTIATTQQQTSSFVTTSVLTISTLSITTAGQITCTMELGGKCFPFIKAWFHFYYTLQNTV